jgi:hypothetical protein
MTTVERYLHAIKAIGLILSMLVFFVALFGFGKNIFSRISRKRSDRDNTGASNG